MVRTGSTKGSKEEQRAILRQPHQLASQALVDRLPADGVNWIGHHRYGPVVHQGTGPHAIGQPMTGANDLQRVAPMLAFALPGMAVEVEAALMVRSIVAPVTITPAVIPGKLLRAAEGPHVVQGPHDRLPDAADVGN